MKKINFPPVDEDLLKVALDTYSLETMVGDDVHEHALRKALSASLIRFEQRVQERIARAAFARANASQDRLDLSSDDVLTYSAALTEFGNSLMETIPSEADNYEPEDGDIVEISLVGEISLNGEDCPNCGHELSSFDWSVSDRYTGAEYWFNDVDFSKAKVRVIKKNEDHYPETVL